jgi:hypothetical protein
MLLALSPETSTVSQTFKYLTRRPFSAIIQNQRVVSRALHTMDPVIWTECTLLSCSNPRFGQEERKGIKCPIFLFTRFLEERGG